ncbi:hypothetical protein H4R35_006214 [Dimargaris xerosporica]|nr:hypothetical protein H4R35_006214 [Dimargaris xerosporica]
MTKQNHRPGSLSAARQSKADVNLQVLRRHDRSVTRIVDLASHVVIYRFNHSKNEWEKQGVEGTLFVYERSQVPYYSFMVMNRLSLDNFCIAIKPSLEILLTPQFIIYRESVQASTATDKVSDYDGHVDAESSDDCEQYVFSSTGELVPAAQSMKAKPKLRQAKRHQTDASTAAKQSGKKSVAPIHAIWVYDAADRKRIAGTLSSLRTAPPPVAAAPKASQPSTLLEDMLQRAKSQTAAAAGGGGTNSRAQSRAEHSRQGHHNGPSSVPVALTASNRLPPAAGKGNTKGPNLLNQFFPGLRQASPEPPTAVQTEKVGPFANTNDLLSALSHSVARPSQPLPTTADHATITAPIAITPPTQPPVPTGQSDVMESAAAASPQPSHPVPPATSHLPMPLPMPVAGMPAFGPPPTHPMHMPIPVYFPGPMPTAQTDAGSVGPEGYAPMVPWPANPVDTVQSTLPGRIAQDTVAKAQQLHAADAASTTNDNDSITDLALLNQDEFEIQLLHTLQTDPALMRMLYQQYCQAVHFLTNPLPDGVMPTVGGAPGMPPMFLAPPGNDSHTNSNHNCGHHGNGSGPNGGTLLPVPGPFPGQYGGPFPPPPPLHMLPVFGNHGSAPPMPQPGGMSTGPNGFALSFPQPLPPADVATVSPAAAAAANINNSKNNLSGPNSGPAMPDGGNVTTGAHFSQPSPLQQNQAPATPTQHDLPSNSGAARPATAHPKIGRSSKRSTRTAKVSAGATVDGGNQLLADQIIRLGGAVQSQ